MERISFVCLVRFVWRDKQKQLEHGLIASQSACNIQHTHEEHIELINDEDIDLLRPGDRIMISFAKRPERVVATPPTKPRAVETPQFRSSSAASPLAAERVSPQVQQSLKDRARAIRERLQAAGSGSGGAHPANQRRQQLPQAAAAAAVAVQFEDEAAEEEASVGEDSPDYD